MTDFCTGCGRQLGADEGFCARCGRARRSGSDASPPASADVAPAPAPPTSGGPKVGAAVGVVAIFGLVVPLVLIAGRSCGGDTEGHVVVSGGPRPGFTFTPTDCDAMSPYGRFGANLHGEGSNDGAIYVTREPGRGAVVEIEVPGSCRNEDGTDCTVFAVPRDRCRTFEADVAFTGVVVNDVRLVEGVVTLECTLDDGTTVRGSVRFDGC